MTAVEAVVERLRSLPPDKQQAVLDFVIRMQASSDSSANARQVMDRIRRDVESRHGMLDVVVPLLREDRDN